MGTTTRLLLFNLLLLSATSSCAMDAMNRESKVGADDQSLPGTAWWVEDIESMGVIDKSHTTIEFTDDGRIVGDTGCNRYFGSIEISGSDITLGPLAGTRKACAASLMHQEMRFYQAMEKVSQWEIEETGLLHLRDADGEDLVRAWATDDH